MNAIEVENMTKIFHVVRRERSVKAAFLKRMAFNRPHREEFVALHDISFNIPKGQSVGVIGKNGSGKSTLLSLLARIYRPTSGRVTVNGRVASLLELGAGFSPDFTGMENIFLNGVIMGLSREELQRKLPDILEFAGIGDFIDTPVKHYSSGMMTRLGFAVAINVGPEVLLVDEVLAVGDAEFQEKCYAKIDEFKARGVTIFFVSHDIRAIERVSDRVIWIEDHVIRADGPPDEVIPQYTHH